MLIKFKVGTTTQVHRQTCRKIYIERFKAPGFNVMEMDATEVK